MSGVIRFRFAVRGQLRFLSHLDLLRTMERALRRSKLPIAFSKGFSPKPKLSFGFALPVGVFSEAEYGDFEFETRLEPLQFVEEFGAQLPEGLEILQAERLPAKAAALMNVIDAAHWQIFLPGRDPRELKERWRWLESVDTFVVERQTKRGKREINIRPCLFSVEQIGALPGGAGLHCLSALGNRGNLRIDEMGSLFGFAHQAALITRMGQLIKEGEKYSQPMGIEGKHG